MTVKSNVVTELFDGVTAPAIPPSVTVDSSVVTAASFPGGSASNCIEFTGSSALKYLESNTAGAVDGNQHAQIKFRATGGADGVLAGPIISQSASPHAGGSGTFYLTFAYAPGTAGHGSGLALYKYVSGSPTQLGILGSPSDFAQNITYVLDITRQFDQNGDGWLFVQCQRLSDNKYFGGQGWAVGKVDALRVCDNTITAGARKAGVEFFLDNGSDTSQVDDFIQDDAYAVTYHAWGDSVTDGFQASGGSYVELLGISLGIGLQNHAVDGSQAADQAAAMLGTAAFNAPTVALAPHPSIIFLGINDFAYYADDSTKKGYYKSALMAATAWASLPTKTLASAGTGSGWTDNPTLYGVTMDQFANVSGTKRTLTGIEGDTIFVFYTAGNNAAYGDFKITIDGVDLATGSCAAVGITTHGPVPGTARANSPQLLIVRGAGPGSHTVDFELTSNGFCFIDAVAGIGNQSAFNKVAVLNLYDFDAAGYTAVGGDTARTAAYNALIDEAVSELAGLGFQVVPVDVHSAIDPLTDLVGGGDIHLTNGGQAKVAAAVEAALVPASPDIATICQWAFHQGTLLADTPTITPGVLCPVSGVTNLASTEQFDCGFTGTFGAYSKTGYHLIPTVSNGHLVIVDGGHEDTLTSGGPDTYGMQNVVRTLVARGNPVFIAPMEDAGTSTHNTWGASYSSTVNPIERFWGLAIALNNLAGRYTDISITGLSGGGWLSATYGAIDPRVNKCIIPVRGTRPILPPGLGDWEQTVTQSRFGDYTPFYALCAAGRKVRIVFNNVDTTFFGPTAAYDDTAYLAPIRVANPSADIQFVEDPDLVAEHFYTQWTIDNALLPSLQNGGPHPVGITTRLGSAGFGVERTKSFSGKSGGSSGSGGPHATSRITRLGSCGHATRRCGSFAGRVSVGPLVVRITLVNTANSPRANLTGLKWAFFDQVTPDLFGGPVDKGTGEITDGSGVLVIPITGTSLTAGGTGWLTVTDSDGTANQSPPHRAFSGPVVLQ